MTEHNENDLIETLTSDTGNKDLDILLAEWADTNNIEDHEKVTSNHGSWSAALAANHAQEGAFDHSEVILYQLVESAAICGHRIEREQNSFLIYSAIK